MEKSHFGNKRCPIQRLTYSKKHEFGCAFIFRSSLFIADFGFINEKKCSEYLIFMSDILILLYFFKSMNVKT